MYEEYWQLDRKPFESNADAHFYYPSESHQGAILKLRYAVENSSGCALITGAPGLGKTQVVQALLAQLPDNLTPCVNLVFPQMPADQLLDYIADELAGIPAKGKVNSIEESIRRIQSTLQANSEAGKKAVLVVDEAHLISDEGIFDTLRLLLNFDTTSQSKLALVLVGQAGILPILDRRPGLEERMVVKCMLRPLTEDETASYIQHRLAQAGGSSDIFEPEAIEAVFGITRGFPRKINRLCDLALLVGFAQELTAINAEHIESVSEELITVVPE
ncbi:MAG: AAA family ATPase [Pirellulaceae bacterium]